MIGVDQIVEKIGGDRLGERIGADESGSDGTSLDSLSGHNYSCFCSYCSPAVHKRIKCFKEYICSLSLKA